MITKEAYEAIKQRLILDCLASGINSITTQVERITLPRVIDLVNDVLDLMANMTVDQIMEFTVLDFTDAFFKVPLLFDDRRYYCTSF